jgi:hypothetical protein
MAIALASYALITVDEYRAYTGDATERDINEDRMHFLINALSQRIADYCDRIICPVTAISNAEKFWGDATNEYRVRHMLISGTPTLYYYSGLDWTEMVSTSYPRELDAATGLIRLLQGHTFSDAMEYRIDYSTGYAQASVPTPIKMVCARMLDRGIKVAEGKEGVSSESFGDQTTSFSFNRWPDDLRAMLNQYRHVRVC